MHNIMYNIINENINKYNITVSGLIMKISPRRSEEFLVNRPFLYTITVAQHGNKTNNSNSLTLFSGRIFTPASSI